MLPRGRPTVRPVRRSYLYCRKPDVTARRLCGQSRDGPFGQAPPVILRRIAHAHRLSAGGRVRRGAAGRVIVMGDDVPRPGTRAADERFAARNEHTDLLCGGSDGGRTVRLRAEDIARDRWLRRHIVDEDADFLIARDDVLRLTIITLCTLAFGSALRGGLAAVPAGLVPR